MTQRVSNRGFVVLGAVLIQLCLGAIYAWSVFTPALQDSGWSKTQTQIVFSVGLAMFALVMVFAGRRLPTWGPRTLAIAGGLTLGIGYAFAAIDGGANFWIVLVGVGFIGGAGIGLAYVVPIAVGMRWFPDHKGMISGAAVAGFGFGALLWIQMADTWGKLIDNFGLDGTFLIYGIAFAALVLVGSIWMVMPPAGWLPAGFTPPAVTGAGGDNFTSSEMLRTPQFYLIFLTFAVSAGGGLMAIGLMKLWPVEALMDGGMLEAEADDIAGLAMAVFFSLANGFGRLAWGWMSDRLGRKRSVVIMTATQAALLLAFIPMAGNEYTLYLAAALIGFNFGGNFALFPALTADEYGDSSVGQNYPWVFLAYGAGGIVFPILGGALGDMDNFPLAFMICAGACALGAIATSLVYPPSREEASKPFSMSGFLHNAHLSDHS
ncbi:MAG: OFA family MFS transporter [Acidimicrobiia bacterium]